MTTLVREIDLLPACPLWRVAKCCPFCGAEPGLAVKRAGFWLVGCENDDCRVNPQAGSNTSPEEAWADWNTRATAKADADMLKLLREVLEWNEDDADLATNDTPFRLKNFADTVSNRSAALRTAIAKAEGC